MRIQADPDPPTALVCCVDPYTCRGCVASLSSCLCGEHPLLLLHIAADQVVEEEEGLRVHGHKDVVLELGDKGADHGGPRVLGGGRPLTLDVVGLRQVEKCENHECISK